MEELKLLKYTVRGLNYRYSALKKINTLLLRAGNLREFLDNVLGLVMELSGATSILALVSDEHQIASLKVFRAEIPYNEEKQIKEKIERMFIAVDSKIPTGYIEPDKKEEYRKTIDKALGGISNIFYITLSLNEKTIGVVELFNIPSNLSEDKREALDAIGAQIAIAIEMFGRIENLRSRTEALKKLSVVTESINYAYQMDTVLENVLQNSCSFFEASGCMILLRNELGKLEYASINGDRENELKNTVIKASEGVASWVFEKGESVLINDVSKDERYSKKYDSMFNMVSGSIIASPLRAGEDIIGVVEIVRTQDLRQFKIQDQSMLEVLSSHAAVAIDKARIFSYKDRGFRSIVELLTGIIATKDNLYPAQNSLLKKHLSILGKSLKLTSDELELLDLAASIQDIGKIVIPEEILTKEDRLSAEEWEQVKQHPLVSAGILGNVKEFKKVIPIIKYHHERYDGSGYPEKLAGEQIPRLARVLSVADAFVAMLSERPYRKAMPESEAVSILLKQKGKDFDPEVVDAFVKILKKA